MVHCIYRVVIGYNFQIKLYFYPNIISVSANNADPDEMPQHVGFNVDFHCFAKVRVWESLVSRVSQI